MGATWPRVAAEAAVARCCRGDPGRTVITRSAAREHVEAVPGDGLPPALDQIFLRDHQMADARINHGGNRAYYMPAHGLDRWFEALSGLA
jgi:hypothetical protein